MPAAIPILLGAIAAAAPYAATAGAAFATGTFLALAGIGAALGALPILLNQIFGPAVPAPTASGKYQNVQINTYTRVGRVPVVYGFRRVGANIIQLGHLEYENITNGGVLEQHLFGEILMAFAEGPGSQILTLYVEDTPQRPSDWREYLGLPAEEEPIVDELVDDTPTDRLPSYPNTIKAFFNGDLGFVSNIPNFAADVRGIYPTIERSGDASYCPGYSVDWTPRSAAMDGPTNTAWFLIEDGAAPFLFPSGMVTWRMPYEGGRAVILYTESPAPVEQAIERAWYMGMIDAVVVQDPLDLTTFYAAKPGTESDGDWIRMSLSPIYRNPILFDFYDDRACRLHTVHQRGDTWLIHVQSFIDGASRWIALPTDFGGSDPFDTMLAFTFKPEDNSYYAVIKEGVSVPTAMRFDLTRQQWVPVLGLGTTPHATQTIRGLVKLGVYLYLVYDESMWQLDTSEESPEWTEIDRADFFDVSEQGRMTETPDVLHCAYCPSRYMGVTLFKNGGEWNMTAWYGPRIEGEQYATEQLFTRYAMFDADGDVRWIDNGEDEPDLNDLTWVTTGPATDLSVAGVISAGNDYKTINEDENLVTLMNGPGPSSATYKDRLRSEAATGGFGGEPEKVRAIMYDRNPRFDAGYGEDRRDYWVELWPEKDQDPEGDYGHLDGTPGQPNGGTVVGHVVSPKYLPASTAPAVRSPYGVAGKQIWYNHMRYQTHDDDPDKNARQIVLQIIDREPLIYRTSGESVYRRPAPNAALVVDTNFGTIFFSSFPLIQFEVRPPGSNDPETKEFIQEELGEENPDNATQWDGRWDLWGVYLDDSDVEQTVLVAGQVKVAEWDAQGTVVFGEGKATVVDMSLSPTAWRHQWWRRLVTPPSEAVDMLTNTRYGRGVPEDRIDLHSYLSFHGYSVEWVRVDDERIQRYIFNHIVNQEQSLSDYFDEVFGPALAYDVSSSDRYKVAFENSDTQALIEFTPSMMKPGSFSSVPKSPKVAVNRVRVRFYSVAIHDEDERTVDDEFDQDITGSIREKELPLATVTDERRASLMARQVLESPIADHSTCSFVTGAFARILEPSDIIAVTHPKGNFVRRPYKIVSILDAGTDEVRIECQEVSPYTIDLAVIGGDEVSAESAIAAAGRDTNIPSQNLADTSIEDFSLEPLMPFRAVMAVDADDSIMPLAHRAPNGAVTVSVRSTWRVGDIGYLSEPTVYEPLSAALPTVSGDTMLLLADGFLRPRVGTFTTPKTAFVVVRRSTSPDYTAIEPVVIEEIVEPPSTDPKSTGTVLITRTPGQPAYEAVTDVADRVWSVSPAAGSYLEEGYFTDGRPIPAAAWNNPGDWTDITAGADPFGGSDDVILVARRDWLVIGISAGKADILPNVLDFVFSEPASANLRLRWEYSVRYDRTSPLAYWKPLTVLDQTHGFTENGKVYFELPQLWRASRFWDANGNGIGGPGTADRTPRFYIRVQRRLARDVTPPTLSYLQTINQPFIVIPPDEAAPSGLYLADTVEQVARFIPRSRYVIDRPPLFPTIRFNSRRRS